MSFLIWLYGFWIWFSNLMQFKGNNDCLHWERKHWQFMVRCGRNTMSPLNPLNQTLRGTFLGDYVFDTVGLFFCQTNQFKTSWLLVTVLDKVGKEKMSSGFWIPDSSPHKPPENFYIFWKTVTSWLPQSYRISGNQPQGLILWVNEMQCNLNLISLGVGC
jgi:hypothetical protein